METLASNTKSDSEKPDKRPYRPPQLFVYGNVREITKAVGNTGAGDGSGTAMLKTSP